MDFNLRTTRASVDSIICGLATNFGVQVEQEIWHKFCTCIFQGSNCDHALRLVITTFIYPSEVSIPTDSDSDIEEWIFSHHNNSLFSNKTAEYSSYTALLILEIYKSDQDTSS